MFLQTCNTFARILFKLFSINTDLLPHWYSLGSRWRFPSMFANSTLIYQFQNRSFVKQKHNVSRKQNITSVLWEWKLSRLGGRQWHVPLWFWCFWPLWLSQLWCFIAALITINALWKLLNQLAHINPTPQCHKCCSKLSQHNIFKLLQLTNEYRRQIYLICYNQAIYDNIYNNIYNQAIDRKPCVIIVPDLFKVILLRYINIKEHI